MTLFAGRINRLEYFIGTVILFVMLFIPVTLSVVIRLLAGDLVSKTTSFLDQILLLLFYGYALVLFIINVSLEARRFHDLNYTGWLSILLYVPIIGWIYAVFLLFLPGKNQNNKYGKETRGMNIKKIFGFS